MTQIVNRVFFAFLLSLTLYTVFITKLGKSFSMESLTGNQTEIDAKNGKGNKIYYRIHCS